MLGRSGPLGSPTLASKHMQAREHAGSPPSDLKPFVPANLRTLAKGTGVDWTLASFCRMYGDSQMQGPCPVKFLSSANAIQQLAPLDSKDVGGGGKDAYKRMDTLGYIRGQ
eukprot:scaffold54394_cov18-Tisochrysis_lutea.AAC.2